MVRVWDPATGASLDTIPTTRRVLAVHEVATLLAIGQDFGVHVGELNLTVVNCGHHPPLLNHGGSLQPLTGTTAALPLGLEDDFTAFTANWLPGDRLLLYTDGLVESRNKHGDFLSEDQIATALLAADCDQALDTLITAVHRHTRGHGHDDIALLLLEHSAYPPSSANGHPPPKKPSSG
jgi:serine/threonine protein phosphatase PrpC